MTRFAVAASVVSLAFALTAGGSRPLAAFARPHVDPVPSTGLRGVAYDRVPTDVVFDTGDGARPLHTRFGRPLVINFWASWCGPCLAELDQFAEANAYYGDRLEIVTISAEAPGVASHFLIERGLGIPVVEDPKKRIAGAFGVGPIPVTIVLRADGTVAHVSVGQLDPGELSAALAPLLQPDAAPSPAPTIEIRPLGTPLVP